MTSHTAKATTYHNLIDGSWVESVSGHLFENRNPANQDDLIGVFQRSTRLDVERAVDSARRAFVSWRLVPAPRRA
ncbi:MAG TPA: aldehyde dehydrogenase family protein, partial [Vicinamibacterales bacterium]